MPTLNQRLEKSILTKLNPIEQQLVQTTINQVKFGVFNNEQKQELAKLLVRMSYFVGIKEPMTIEQLKLLITFLCTRFPYNSMEQIEQAFMMACSGELGDFEHYQNFSPQYVSKIIKAHDTQRSLAMRKYREIKEKKELDELSKEKAKAFDIFQATLDVLRTEYDKWLKSNGNKPNDSQEYQSTIAVRFGQKIGLFKDYNEKEIYASEYLSRLFVSLQVPSKENTFGAVEKYVRSNGKNMEH